MKLLFEKIMPYAFAGLTAWFWCVLEITLPADTAILNASLTLGAILTGFIATAQSIIMTLDSPVMQRIRKTRYLTLLVSYLGQAVWLSLCFVVVSLVGFFVGTTDQYYGLMWVASGVASGIAFIRVVNITLQIIQYPER